MKTATRTRSPGPRASNGLNSVSIRSSEIFARPMMRKFIEYRTSMTRIPERILLIPSLRLSRNVAVPAAKPAIAAKPIASHGEYPADNMVAKTAAPNVKLPSTVRSGQLSTRSVNTTPKTAIAYKKPCWQAESRMPGIIRRPLPPS